MEAERHLGYMSATLATAGWMTHPTQTVNSTSAGSLELRFEREAMPHLGDLFRTATRVTGDRSRAEDVVQETFLQAWKSFGRFQPGTNCRAWLYKILFHCLSHYRRKFLRFPLLDDATGFLESSIPYSAPIPESLTDEQILAALDRIPVDFRSVVLLSDVEEFAYKEVAEILGIPIGTVMSRLSRARKMLRGHLGDVAKEYGIGRQSEKGTNA